MEKIGVIGLGYVGLPVAMALADKFDGVVGFDVNSQRIADLKRGHDWTEEVSADRLNGTNLVVTDDPAGLSDCTFFIVTVPTPIDEQRRPDLRPIHAACRTVGKVLKPGAIVVFESTVYPGVTEDECGPLLEQVSGLRCGTDFKLGYSPERINPGDRQHTVETITKIVAAQDAQSLARVEAVYGAIVRAGLHSASSIKVAEAAKVLENTQRDLNIALMNEVAIICDRLGIRTIDVLEAAGTKWNFLPFRPGLVGGHCIGVDPYYLTAKAESLGYHPEVILAGRRINDGMGAFVAQRIIKLLIEADTPVRRARVAVLGLAFKEDVRDIRNSRVPDIVAELASFGVNALVHDPLCEPDHAHEEYGITLSALPEPGTMDAIVFAVPHQEFKSDLSRLIGLVRNGGILVDVKSAIPLHMVPSALRYWSL